MESHTRSGGGFVFGPFRLDPESRHLARDGTRVLLTDHPFHVLHTLVVRAGEVVPKDALIDATWGRGAALGDNSLAQVIVQLRRLLDAADANRYIQTVSRQGYRFAAPVTLADVTIDGDA